MRGSVAFPSEFSPARCRDLTQKRAESQARRRAKAGKREKRGDYVISRTSKGCKFHKAIAQFPQLRVETIITGLAMLFFSLLRSTFTLRSTGISQKLIHSKLKSVYLQV